MSLILLADDSPHARRMGERILSEEGYRVSILADGEGALEQLKAFDPDLLIAAATLAGKSGLDLCRYVKANLPHTRVILTAGALEPVDEEKARIMGCDSLLRKPFEASMMIATVAPLMEAARKGRLSNSVPASADTHQIQALVEQAVAAETPRLIEEITARVVGALGRPK